MVIENRTDADNLLTEYAEYQHKSVITESTKSGKNRKNRRLFVMSMNGERTLKCYLLG